MASSPTAKGSTNTGAFASSPTLLRRKMDGPGGAYGVATKVFDVVRDSVGAVGKMVASSDSAVKAPSTKALTTPIGSINADAQQNMPAHIADITHAFSVGLCHILAPLWCVGVDLIPIPASALPRIDYGSPAIMNFAQQVIDHLPIDSDIDLIAEHLSRDRAYATVFIVVMLAKVLLLERTFQRGSLSAASVSEEDFTRSSTQDLLANLEQELRVKSSEPTKDTWPNDETSTSDMPMRLLSEVGGAANKPRGPAELSPFLSHYRRRCLVRALQVSVCFPYYYCDTGVQYVCEAIAAQLFLVNFSEALVTLVSGRKGPCYIGKFIIHLAGTRPAPKDSVDTLVTVAAQSTTLTQINQLVGLSFDNFLHRNDIAETALPAMVSAIQHSPTSYLGAVMRYNQMLLHDVNCPDIGLLVNLMDSARRHITTPSPIGDSALSLVRAAWTSIRCVGCLQRDAMCRTFVAGAQMRSFRRRPIHMVTNVFAARSFITTKMARLPVPVQRSLQNFRVPISASGRVDPVTGQPLPQGEFSDDAIKYVSNVIINVFQAAVELCETGLELAEAKHAEENNPAALGRTMGAAVLANDGNGNNNNNNSQSQNNNNAEEIKASLRLINAPQVRDNVLMIARTIVEHVDLRILYSIPPSIMVANVQRVIALFPKQIIAGQHSDINKLRVFSDLSHASPAVLSAIYEIYLSIADYAKPVRGIAKTYRNENAMRPARPLLTSVLTESEPVTESFREMCMALWKHCDARILDSEPASAHPQKDLALSQFVEDEMDIALMAGGGTLRRLATAIVSQKIEFPGTVPSPRFFVLPAGGDNDLASWIARCDATYRVNVYGPIAIRQPTKASVKPDELAQPNELAQHPPPSFDALLLRRTLDFYAQNARYANDVLVYQVECHCADGTKGVTMMCSNFEIGLHLNVAAVATQTSTGKESLISPPVPRGNTAGGGVSDKASVGSMPSTVAAASPSARGRASSNFGDAQSTNSGGAGTDRGSQGGGGILPSTFKPLPRYEGEGDPTPWSGMTHIKAAKEYLKTSCGQLFVQIGDVIESADWLMLQMHGPNGLRLQTRKNPSDSNSVVHNCATGSDVLDWLGSVYHAFDTRSAIQAAQHLLELGFLSCVAVSPGRSPATFHEVCLYVPRARHGTDYPTPPIPTNKSRPYGIAQGVKDVLSSLSHASALDADTGKSAAMEPGTGGKRFDIPKPIPQLECRVRVGFTHRSQDAHYYELSPPSEDVVSSVASGQGAGAGGMGHGHGGGGASAADPAAPKGPADIVRPRDVVFIKVRSCGSAGDAGPVADPCSCALEMSICEVSTAGRKDSIVPRDATNSNGEPTAPPMEQRHFTLHFGARDADTGKLVIDPKCELAIDTAIPAPDERTSPLARDQGGPANLFCAVDGDVLGPFCAFRIRPVILDYTAKRPATLSVMSFTPLGSDI